MRGCGSVLPGWYCKVGPLLEFDLPYEYFDFACDLGNLTNPQLKELIARVVAKEFLIFVSEDWNADKKKHGCIFLIRDSDYKKLDVADRIELDRMKDRYEQALKDSVIDRMILAPLAYCIDVAGEIKKKKSAIGEGQTTKEKQKRRSPIARVQSLYEAIEDWVYNDHTATRTAIEGKWELGQGALSKPDAKEIEKKIRDKKAKASMTDRKVSKEVGDDYLNEIKK
jgi:hypothetical protein